jgi:hemin uptake protein HemP
MTLIKPKPSRSADERSFKQAAHSRSYGPALSPALPCVRSEDLLGVDRGIMIEHADAYHRLRLTRVNKLILTK